MQIRRFCIRIGEFRTPLSAPSLQLHHHDGDAGAGEPEPRRPFCRTATIKILYNINIVIIFAQRTHCMEFVKILDDKRLWAVKYEGETDNCFDLLFSSWYDMNWLRSFFHENIEDLS